MLRTTHIKAAMLSLLFISPFIYITSCSNNQNSDNAKDVAEQQNKDRFDNKDQKDDAQFLVNASESNLKEIYLGQLAQQKGNSPDVRELGKMMEDAHTKSQRELIALAEQKGISIPDRTTEDAQDTYNKLNDESGNDFDKAYTDKVVSRHKDSIDRFEKASKDSHDADIRNWAASSLPDLRRHHDHSINSQRKSSEMQLRDNN